MKTTETVPCEWCDGTGTDDKTLATPRACTHCVGQGHVERDVPWPTPNPEPEVPNGPTE